MKETTVLAYLRAEHTKQTGPYSGHRHQTIVNNARLDHKPRELREFAARRNVVSPARECQVDNPARMHHFTRALMASRFVIWKVFGNVVSMASTTRLDRRSMSLGQWNAMPSYSFS